MTERIVNSDRVEDLITVFGSFDENIKRIEDALSVTIVNRGTELRIAGEPIEVDKAARTLEGLLALAAKGEVIDEQKVRYLITLVQEGTPASIATKRHFIRLIFISHALYYKLSGMSMQNLSTPFSKTFL